jgi:hypothetical protein
LAKDAKKKSHLSRKVRLHAWVRVSPEDAAQKKQEVSLCYNMLPAARRPLLEKYKTTGGLSPNMELLCLQYLLIFAAKRKKFREA